MEDNSKKRRRKTKLVPREYLDSDDENIAQMQNEIEETIAKINPLSILKKLEPKNPKPLEFSVKVEVEEFDEPEPELLDVPEEVEKSIKTEQITLEDSIEESQANSTEVSGEASIDEPDKTEPIKDEASKQLNIKIQSIKSLSENPTPIVPTDFLYYKITDDMLREEFNLVSQGTTAQADKLLEIYIRNMFGRKPAYMPQSSLDELLQNKLKKWKVWHLTFPDIREAPIMYLCYVCDMGFWHFSEFREHVVDHKDLYYRMESQNHDFRLIAHQGSTFERGKDHVECFISNCWKCGKDVSIHLRAVYKCDGCKKAHHNCTLLSLHEGTCEAYKEIYRQKGVDTFKSYTCPVCPYRHWEEEKLERHMTSHTVRSDLPILWTTKHCPKCSLAFQDYRVHECLNRPLMEACDYCSTKFQSKPALALHLSNSVVNTQCRVCDVNLKRGCMEAEHLLKHTKTYVMLYKCTFCMAPTYFLDYRSINDHRMTKHFTSKKLFYDKVIVPRTLLKKLDPVLNHTPRTNNLIPPTTGLNFDNACQGLIGYLDTKKAIREAIYEADPHPPDGLFDAELGVEVTIISKNVAQKLLNKTKADLKAKKICDKFASELIDKDRIKVNKTYVNKKKMKQDNEVTNVEIKTEPNEVENDSNESEIKQEMMDIDDMIVTSEVKSETEVQDEVNYEFQLEECEDETDMISWDADYEEQIDNEQLENVTAERDPASIPKRLNRCNGLPLKSITNKYMCTKCNTTYQTMRKYLNHFDSHGYKPTSCPKCFKGFTWPQNLMAHVNLHIKNSFVILHAIKDRKVETKSHYQCRKCKAALGITDFFQHWESHLDIKDVGVEESKRYVVDMDGKPLLKEMLAILLGLDSSDPDAEEWKLRVCVGCEKRFERRNDCKRHYIEHLLTDAYSERHKYGALICQICGADFQKSEIYKRHMRDHASLPIYKCELCDKTFSDSSNFCKHKKVHNLDVLICDTCKKKFNNKTSLIRHIQFHEIVKPIECKTCDKVFYSHSSYNKHKKKSRFKCPVCNTYYTSVKQKWDHMWQVHKERKYEADCPLCSQSFRKFLDVKQHLRDVHNETNFVYYKSGLKAKRKRERTKNDTKREEDDEIVIV